MKEEKKSLTLKVKEALSKDVGRAIARIDPQDMKDLELDVGEIVEIEGKRKTPAKVMPCYAEDRGKKLIQVDGITRENSSVGLDEKVKVRKVDYKPANKINLSPLTVSSLFTPLDKSLSNGARRDKDTKYLGSLIDGLPVATGDRIRATLFGSRSCDFKVLDTIPDGIVLINSNTLIKMRTEKVGEGKPAKISYEDIGGLDSQIQRIREMIELPLKYPQIFERLGIDAPKGVFLYGPPGCGKTLIARAVANETDAYFTSISGPEIMGRFYGESEQRLRSVFEDAKTNAPAIIFIDEIESIAPKREEMGAEKQVERRVVAQLLSLMDGLESRGQVIVMAASVTGDTPVLVKGQGLVSIGSLVDRYYSEGVQGHSIPVQGLEVLGFEPGDYGHRRKAHRFIGAKFQPVTAVFRHRVRDVCEIEITGGHKIRVTPGHSLFIRGHGGVKPVKAADLCPGNMLVGLPYSSYMFNRFCRPVMFEPIVPHTPGSSPLDEETAYLFGLWLAEGCICGNKRIDFCLSEKETQLRERVKAWGKRLGRKVYNCPTRLGGAVNVGFTYAKLARFITDNFGAGARNKHLPDWLFTLPDRLFLSLLSGWKDGDGWERNDGCVEITTISRELAIGMLWACRMHNIWVSMSSFQYNGFGSGIAYRLHFSRNNPWNSRQSERWPKRVQPRVKSVKKRPFNGYVYDLCGCKGEAFYGGGMPILLHNTNVPNIVDPALRRPGRFDREISIPIPDKNGRLEILQIHTRGMPLADDACPHTNLNIAQGKYEIGVGVNLEKLAGITHGFVGADLEALAREAAMSALRKILPKIDFEMADIPYETLMKLEVTMDNFLEAMKEVEPSAIREVFVEVPDVKWEDVGGLQNIKEELKEAIEWPLKHSDVFKKANTNPPKGILLYGIPGTGKTLLAKAVANESGVNFISIKGPQLISRYVGESERGVREIFKKAKQAAPTILFLDEIDSLVPKRGSASTDSHVTERVISQFLTEMDGIEELKGVVVLAASNRLDLVDPALLRSGRFDLLLELPKPNQKTREEIFKIHTKDKPLAKDVDLKALAKETDDRVGSDIEFICRKASMFAIREFIENPKDKLAIKIKHFEDAIKLVKKQQDKGA